MDIMKLVKHTDMLQAIIGCFVFITIVSMGTGKCFAVNPSPVELNVTVENIAYQGHNRYMVDIAIYNRSDKPILLKECRETFYVQTDVLGRWEELSALASSKAGSALLPPHKRLQVVYILNIPLTIQSLYRNSEGDINMMFKYLIRYVFGSRADVHSHYGESSYWITPKTNNWILREGM